MKTIVLPEIDHLKIAFAAAEETVKEIELKLMDKYPALAIATSHIEEIEMIEFEPVYSEREGEWELNDWVFGVRSKFGQWILSDHLFVIEALVKDRVQKAITKEVDEH